jgi:hypothetical protein
MFDNKTHLKNLIRHLDLVRENCLLLGDKFIDSGRVDLGESLIARGYAHDASKFKGIEWLFLHRGPDTPQDKLDLAMREHWSKNDHHPEFWGAIEHMPEVAVAEMLCDWQARSTEHWQARSTERGTAVRTWIKETGIDKFKIDLKGKQWGWIEDHLNKLLEDTFVPRK